MDFSRRQLSSYCSGFTVQIITRYLCCLLQSLLLCRDCLRSPRLLIIPSSRTNSSPEEYTFKGKHHITVMRLTNSIKKGLFRLNVSYALYPREHKNHQRPGNYLRTSAPAVVRRIRSWSLDVRIAGLSLPTSRLRSPLLAAPPSWNKKIKDKKLAVEDIEAIHITSSMAIGCSSLPVIEDFSLQVPSFFISNPDACKERLLSSIMSRRP